MPFSRSQAPVVPGSSFEAAFVVVCVEVVAATLFTYDYFTTLASEVELVWGGKWGAGKILFLMGRYVMWPEVVLVFYYALFKDAPSHCRFTFTYSICSVLTALTIADAILILRTWAIWGTSRRVLFFLSALLCALTATNAYYFARDLQEFILIPPGQLDPSIAKVLGRHGCTVTAMGRDVGVPWIAVAAFELVIFLMTTFKLRGVKGRSSRLSSSIRLDGTLYSTFLFGVSSANAVLVYTQPAEYILLLLLMQGILHSILTCKLVLHIRSVAHEEAALSPSQLTLSTIVWDPKEQSGAV